MRALWGHSRLWTATGIVMLLSAVPSIAGAVGAFVGSELLAAGCLVGGVLSWPAFGLLAVALGRERRALAPARQGSLP